MDPLEIFRFILYCIILGGALFVSHNSIISLIKFLFLGIDS